MKLTTATQAGITRAPYRIAVVALLVVGAAVACRRTEAAPADPDAALMTEGVQLLYQSGDPFGAEARFRQVLQRTPTHYGAHYQLAVALDSSGRPVQARAAWETMWRLASEIGDTAVMSRVRRRLDGPDTTTQVAMMRLGLQQLHVDQNPAAAVEQFRAVLRRNPTHYGATYQLATALDRSGRASEARPVWVKMLGMAVAVNDTTTSRVARERLAR